MAQDPITRIVAVPPWGRAAPWAPRDPAAAAWFRDHACRVADRFVRPLLERHREAADAGWPEVRGAYRLDTLAEDAVRAAHDAVDATLQAYGTLAGRVIAERRLGRRGRRTAAPGPGVETVLRRQADELAARLGPRIAELRRTQGQSPWESALERLDGSWAAAWDDLGRAIAATWSTTLGPALVRLDELSPGRPTWIVPVALAVVALALVAVWIAL